MNHNIFYGKYHREEWRRILDQGQPEIQYGELENAIHENQAKLIWLMERFPNATPEMEEISEQLEYQKALFQRMYYDI